MDRPPHDESRINRRTLIRQQESTESFLLPPDSRAQFRSIPDAEETPEDRQSFGI